VALPIFKLALATAIPSLLAPGAPLRGLITAHGADRIVKEIVEHVIRIEFHHPFHVLLGLGGVGRKESFFLLTRYFFPVLILIYTRAHFGNRLDDKRIVGADVARVATQTHFFEGAVHVA